MRRLIWGLLVAHTTLLEISCTSSFIIGMFISKLSHFWKHLITLRWQSHKQKKAFKEWNHFSHYYVKHFGPLRFLCCVLFLSFSFSFHCYVSGLRWKYMVLFYKLFPLYILLTGLSCDKDWKTKWATTCDFQQCDMLTSVDPDEPVQLPFKLRHSKW